ncbi:MAG TPA: hypothetical protein VF945_01305, partial [Polyangia bacterium]
MNTHALAWILALFPLGCVGYILVTYALVLVERPRTVPLAVTGRAALTELFVTLTLLPFWPLWMLFGAAYDRARDGERAGERRPIVLLHGFLLTQTS